MTQTRLASVSVKENRLAHLSQLLKETLQAPRMSEAKLSQCDSPRVASNDLANNSTSRSSRLRRRHVVLSAITVSSTQSPASSSFHHIARRQTTFPLGSPDVRSPRRRLRLSVSGGDDTLWIYQGSTYLSARTLASDGLQRPCVLSGYDISAGSSAIVRTNTLSAHPLVC